jgi:hypothetical protein
VVVVVVVVVVGWGWRERHNTRGVFEVFGAKSGGARGSGGKLLRW